MSLEVLKVPLGEKPLRKIVQQSVAVVQTADMTILDYVVTAVCNDGSVWFLTVGSMKWARLPEIPQHD